ncbi:MAG: energy-coupling factor ABC transporter permease [Candidatus Hodarchaeota archaeon]
MHIPDGILAPWLWIAFLVVTLIILAICFYKLEKELDEEFVPYIGVLAAFIFAAQFVNFPVPVPGGTSGHLVGGTLIAAILGPWAAPIIMILVLLIQAIMGDGGITAIGVNLFNMGIIGGMFGYVLIVLFVKILGRKLDTRKNLIISTAIASFITIVVAALMVPIELQLSGVVSWEVSLPPMLIYHSIIGIGEAAITAAVVAYITKAKPELITTIDNLGLEAIE